MRNPANRHVGRWIRPEQPDLFTVKADDKGFVVFASGIARKFPVPVGAAQDAISFLGLAGVNEFAIFPDLDGLARHLKNEHVSWL